MDVAAQTIVDLNRASTFRGCHSTPRDVTRPQRHTRIEKCWCGACLSICHPARYLPMTMYHDLILWAVSEFIRLQKEETYSVAGQHAINERSIRAARAASLVTPREGLSVWSWPEISRTRLTSILGRTQNVEPMKYSETRGLIADIQLRSSSSSQGVCRSLAFRDSSERGQCSIVADPTRLRPCHKSRAKGRKCQMRRPNFASELEFCCISNTYCLAVSD